MKKLQCWICSLVVVMIMSHMVSMAQSMEELDKWTTESRRKDIAGQNVYYFNGSLSQFRKVEAGVKHWVEEGVYLEGDRRFYKRGGPRLSQEMQNAFIRANIKIDYNGKMIGVRVSILGKTTMLAKEISEGIGYDIVEIYDTRLLDGADFSKYNITKRILLSKVVIDSSVLLQGNKFEKMEVVSVVTNNAITIEDIEVSNHIAFMKSDSIPAIVFTDGQIGTSGSDTLGLTLSDLQMADSIVVHGTIIHTNLRMDRISVGKLILDENTQVSGKVNMENVEIRNYGQLHEKSFANGLDLDAIKIGGHMDLFVNSNERRRTLFKYRWSDIRDGRLKLRKYRTDTEDEYRDALVEIYQNIANQYRWKRDERLAEEVENRLERTLRDREGGAQRIVNILFQEKGIPVAIWILLGLWLLSTIVYLSRASLRYELIQLHEWMPQRKQSRWLLFIASSHFSAALVFGIKYQRCWLRENQIGFVTYGIIVWMISKAIYGIAVVYAINNVPVFDFVRSWFVS